MLPKIANYRIQRQFGSRAIETLKSTSDRFKNQIKGTMVEKWIKYWKLVTKDYTDVARNVKREIKEKPLKATVYFTGIGFGGLCLKLNPDLRSFRAIYIQSSNELGLVHSTLANPRSVTHLRYIEKSFNGKYLRYTNFGLFSIIWVDKYSDECNTYESNCSYLQVPYWDIVNRVLDVGFLNVWWIISRQMLDFDINY